MNSAFAAGGISLIRKPYSESLLAIYSRNESAAIFYIIAIRGFDDARKGVSSFRLLELVLKLVYLDLAASLLVVISPHVC